MSTPASARFEPAWYLVPFLVTAACTDADVLATDSREQKDEAASYRDGGQDADAATARRIDVPTEATIVLDVYVASFPPRIDACSGQDARFTLRPDRTLTSVQCKPVETDADVPSEGDGGTVITTKDVPLTEAAYADLVAKVRAVRVLTERSNRTDNPQLAFDIVLAGGEATRYCSEGTRPGQCAGLRVDGAVEPMYAFYAAASGAQP